MRQVPTSHVGQYEESVDMFSGEETGRGTRPRISPEQAVDDARKQRGLQLRDFVGQQGFLDNVHHVATSASVRQKLSKET